MWGFAKHSLTCSIPFLLSWVVLGLARSDWFQVGKVATSVLWGLVLVIFLAARVPARPTAALILPPLLLLCATGLRRNAIREQRPDLLAGLLGEIRPRNGIALALMPLAAIAVYAVFRSLRLFLPTNVVLYTITMPLGFWFFFQSLWIIFRPLRKEVSHHDWIE